MVTADHGSTRDVRVGETGPTIEEQLILEDGTPLDLTGYAATIRFWYPGSAGHINRGCKISDAENGVVQYFPRGDEYPTVGTVLRQVTVMAPQWSPTSFGRGFFRQSFEVTKRRVLGAP